ncbi:uncharacterized protein LOC116614704 isoform X1 [Nematostella vectensis]|uniref:uncharacterized protein LOC116614704 isoform X1 n=1 Tax=Nematostella vectensis TaxID=45351 RepID=UPI00207775A6|nr:uncharacterized protein LOC116614704 isoform X1 [Nematostella vectensis]XP_032231900.2 uncharacterized protein LOC116614704 isoform X1 [Nematostella vectensis]
MGDRWYKLKMPCPVSYCPNKEKMQETWVCSKDGTTMYVSQKGVLECARGLGLLPHSGKIVNWKFDCGYRGANSPHSCDTRFLAPDKQGFAHAMSIAVAQMGCAGATWVTQLVREITDQGATLAD